MSSELMRVTEDRPAVIEAAGGRVFVSVHDEYYRRMYRQWKNTLKLAHPDMHPQRAVSVAARSSARSRAYTYVRMYREKGPRNQTWAATFRSLRGQFETWKKREAAWYAHHDLAPPQW